MHVTFRPHLTAQTPIDPPPVTCGPLLTTLTPIIHPVGPSPPTLRASRAFHVTTPSTDPHIHPYPPIGRTTAGLSTLLAHALQPWMASMSVRCKVRMLCILLVDAQARARPSWELPCPARASPFMACPRD